nr:hypothetical protein [Nocardioides flavescens]
MELGVTQRDGIVSLHVEPGVSPHAVCVASDADDDLARHVLRREPGLEDQAAFETRG